MAATQEQAKDYIMGGLEAAKAGLNDILTKGTQAIGDAIGGNNKAVEVVDKAVVSDATLQAIRESDATLQAIKENFDKIPSGPEHDEAERLLKHYKYYPDFYKWLPEQLAALEQISKLSPDLKAFVYEYVEKNGCDYSKALEEAKKSGIK